MVVSVDFLQASEQHVQAPVSAVTGISVDFDKQLSNMLRSLGVP